MIKKSNTKKRAVKSETRNSSNKKFTKVRIYTTSTCAWCVKAKEFLNAHNIKYIELNVGIDSNARNDMFEKSGQFGVPVIEINGTLIIGFDASAIKKALGIK